MDDLKRHRAAQGEALLKIGVRSELVFHERNWRPTTLAERDQATFQEGTERGRSAIRLPLLFAEARVRHPEFKGRSLVLRS